MFCLAMRRQTYRHLGPLDERYEVGLLEDDDYADRAREAGYQLRCVEDVVVHHFGEASFGKLVAGGEYARILRAEPAALRGEVGAPLGALRAPPQPPLRARGRASARGGQGGRPGGRRRCW